MQHFTVSLLVLFVATCVYADVYMHNPRGSNDRNCERNDNRNNGNRLFDSQNNGKGGYACPRAVGGPEVKGNNMYYYVGSQLAIEWTAQHGCGPNSKVHCDIVIQYMCDDANPDLRDGTPDNLQDAATDRVPDNEEESKKLRFGLHETFEYYQRCKHRRRNHGLFIADRNVRTDATGTRQNNNGNRNGFECPEERDHYPYWQPTPWKDIAILTHDPARCDWYRANSNNVKKYGYCDGKREGNGPHVPNFKEECEERGFNWVESSHNLPEPECGEAEWSRVNQLGNTLNGYPMTYNWTIPDDVHETCVLRLRYNISTGEYPENTGLDMPYFTHAQNSKIKENKAKFPSPMISSASLPEEHMKDRPFYVTSPDAPGDAATAYEEAIKDESCEGTFQDLVREYKAEDADDCKQKCMSFGDASPAAQYMREGQMKGMCHCRGGNLKPKDASKGSCFVKFEAKPTQSRCKDMPVGEWVDDMSYGGRLGRAATMNNCQRRNWANYCGAKVEYKIVPAYSPGMDCYKRKGFGTDDKSPKWFFGLAMNSNQFGRTFQDRSFTFGIKPRPDDIPKDAAIQNLNVRGKRGNIVQAYPAVEYDFVPQELTVNESSYIHFQWEGSDYNPRRGPNNGEGGPPDKADNDPNQNCRADRSNIVETSLGDVNIPEPKYHDIANSMFESKDQAWRMAFLDQKAEDCKTMAQLAAITSERRRQNDIGNCGKLNAQAHPYFDGGLVQMNKPGRFTYMSTRNNNFSNRSQKGIITIKPTNGPAAANPLHAGLSTGSVKAERFVEFKATAAANDKLRQELESKQIGCFQDNKGGRDLPHLGVSPTNAFTPTLCLEKCKADGYKFAGLQNANECWCGNHFGRQGRLASHFCNRACAGEKSLECGGPSANLVYAVDTAADDKSVTEGTGCFIDFSAGGCAREPTKYTKETTKMHDMWGRNDANRRSDDSAEKCMVRAADWMRHCRNPGNQPIKAIYVGEGSEEVSGTFPGTLGGCTYSIPRCRHADRKGKAHYFPTWNPDGSDGDEAKCLAYARNIFEDCREPNWDKVEPVVATYHGTGASQAWPSKEGGGCLIDIPKDCGHSRYKVHAGKTIVENRDEAACARRAREYKDACFTGSRRYVYKTKPSVATSTYLKTGKAYTYPGTGGGCVIHTTKCPRRDGMYQGYIVENRDRESCVNNRGKDWWRTCGSDAAHTVVVTYGDEKPVSYPAEEAEQ